MFTETTVTIEHYENPKNSMIENSLKTEKREMTFSLTQSNILYLLFILGSAVCILEELNILGLRESTPSTMLKAILVILPINILLWLDFNFMASSSIVKRHMVLFQISKLLDFYYKDIIVGVFGEIFQDFLSLTTNATFCIILLPFFLVQKLMRIFLRNSP